MQERSCGSLTNFSIVEHGCILLIPVLVQSIILPCRLSKPEPFPRVILVAEILTISLVAIKSLLQWTKKINLKRKKNLL